MARQKKPVHRVQMTEGKRNIIHQLLEEYDIQSAEDIQDALKDLLGGTIKEMMEADRKEAAPERVEAEIVYAPVVAETHEYQYNADAFEARGAADMKVEIGKEVSKVREDKAR